MTGYQQGGEKYDLPAIIEKASGAIAEADALFALSGAGMSVDAGLPDFRGPNGLWSDLEASRRFGRPSAFVTDAKAAWGFYGDRLARAQATVPHDGYRVLNAIASSKRLGGFILTSNVDGLHRKSGWPSERLNECHGRLNEAQCSRPCTREVWSITPSSCEVRDGRLASPLPCCPRCGAVARPAINFFGDDAWIDDEVKAADGRLATWLHSVQGAKVVVIEVGAGTKLPFIRRNAEIIAAELRVPVIRINLHEALAGPGVIPINLGAAEALAAIGHQLEVRP